MFPPTTAFAQAGLTGNALEGQRDERLGRNSKFDNGTLRSQSALGQLEEMSGGKVDRSSSSSSNRQTTTRAPAPRPAKPRFDANQAFKQELAGAVAGALIGALFSDNSAQQRAAAEAEAARAAAQAAAEAEAFRVQQELARLARIQRAKTYRADWDARETEIGGRLSGAFEVHSGTAFFGQPANPDADAIAAILGQDIPNPPGPPTDLVDAPISAPSPGAPDDSDPSVVDLRGSSLVVQPMRPGVVSARGPIRSSGAPTPRWAYEMQERPGSSTRRHEPGELESMLLAFGSLLGKFDKDEYIRGKIESTLWDKAKKLPFGKYAKAVYDANGERIEDTEELSGIYGEEMQSSFGRTTSIAGVLASRSTSDGGYIEQDSAALDHDGRKMVVKFYKMALGKVAGKFEASDDEDSSSAPDDGGTAYINGAPNGFNLHWRMSSLGSGGR